MSVEQLNVALRMISARLAQVMTNREIRFFELKKITIENFEREKEFYLLSRFDQMFQQHRKQLFHRI